MVKKPSEEEEKYFKEVELERRKKAELQAELDALTEKDAQDVAAILKINDMDLARELVHLGFAGDTVGVFSLLPLVYVAWADGTVTGAERRRVLEIAEDHGARSGSPGHDFLEKLLGTRPKAAFFDTCITTIRKIFEHRTDTTGESDKENLVSLSLSVAEASGGFLGVFGDRVSDNERKVLGDMLDALSLDESASAKELIDAIKA